MNVLIIIGIVAGAIYLLFGLYQCFVLEPNITFETKTKLVRGLIIFSAYLYLIFLWPVPLYRISKSEKK